MRTHEEGFLPSSALSSSNPIKVLLPWGPPVLPAARPTAHLKTSPTRRHCPPQAKVFTLDTQRTCIYLNCARSHTHTHTRIYRQTIFHIFQKECVWPRELTSHHHPAVGNHYLNPPGPGCPSLSSLRSAQATNLLKHMLHSLHRTHCFHITCCLWTLQQNM